MKYVESIRKYIIYFQNRDTLKDMSSLTKLIVKGDGGPLYLVKETFENLTSIEEIQLRSCGLAELPSEIFAANHNLKILDLSENEFKIISK